MSTRLLATECFEGKHAPYCKGYNGPVDNPNFYCGCVCHKRDDERVKELIQGLDIAINSCRDVTTLRRFAASVDPVGWVRELQAHLESVAKNAHNLLPVQPAASTPTEEQIKRIKVRQDERRRWKSPRSSYPNSYPDPMPDIDYLLSLLSSPESHTTGIDPTLGYDPVEHAKNMQWLKEQEARQLIPESRIDESAVIRPGLPTPNSPYCIYCGRKDSGNDYCGKQRGLQKCVFTAAASTEARDERKRPYDSIRRIKVEFPVDKATPPDFTEHEVWYKCVTPNCGWEGPRPKGIPPDYHAWCPRCRHALAVKTTSDFTEQAQQLVKWFDRECQPLHKQPAQLLVVRIASLAAEAATAAVTQAQIIIRDYQSLSAREFFNEYHTEDLIAAIGNEGKTE